MDNKTVEPIKILRKNSKEIDYIKFDIIEKEQQPKKPNTKILNEALVLEMIDEKLNQKDLQLNQENNSNF